jgi:hypothetical protein
VRLRPPRVAAATAVVALSVGIPLAAGAGRAAASSTWAATAAGDGIRVGVVVQDFLVVSDIVDAGGPAAQAVLNAFGDSKAYAAYPYPGEIVLTAHGLSQGAAPDYPLIAHSNPTQPSNDVKQGPYTLHAESADDASSASARAAAGGGGVAAGTTGSTAAVRHDDDGAVTADAESTLEGISVKGVLSIGRFHSRAHLVSTPDGPPVRVTDTEIADVNVGGQEVGITDKGLVLAGTQTPLPPDSTANAALSSAGITVHYVAGSRSKTSLVAPGLAISVAQDVAGVGETTVTYVLGQAAVSAQASGATNVGTAIDGSSPTFGAGAPDGPAAGGAIPVDGSASTAPAGIAGAASDGGADQPPVTAGAPTDRNVFGLAGVTGPSSSSLYLVVAVGAIVMVAAAQLFRLLAVKLTWN